MNLLNDIAQQPKRTPLESEVIQSHTKIKNYNKDNNTIR